jgi:tRNA threonylcarbamoyladenosine biosynthesis protein TsaB
MMEAPARPLLAFDTATPTARVAIVSGAGECLAAREKTAARHSANLLGLIDEVLREANVTVGALGGLACGAGPGSFTGLRVGLAVAKGLALPTGLPLVLVSSLDALAADLAATLSAPGLVVPCIDAGKGQIYARPYDAGPGQEPVPRADGDWVLAPADLGPLASAAAAGKLVVAGGSGVDRYADILRDLLGAPSVRLMAAGPSALAVASLARQRLARGEHDDLATAVPRYGRPPDITRPKRQPGRPL